MLTAGFDGKNSRREADQLYREGREMVRSESSNRPLSEEIVSPVVVELGKVLSLEAIQHQVALQRTLSKAYRLFHRADLASVLATAATPHLFPAA